MSEIQPLERFRAAFDFAAHVHTYASGAANQVDHPVSLMLIAATANRLSEVCCCPATSFEEIRYRIVALVETLAAYRSVTSCMRPPKDYEHKLVNLYRRCPQIRRFVETGERGNLRGTLQTTN